MSKKIERPTPEQYEQRANRMAREWCPRMYACYKCGWPVFSGYCCRTCGDGSPYEAEEGADNRP